MKNIQIGILVVFGFFIVLGIFVFAGFIPSPKSARDAQTQGNVTLWGTLPQKVMSNIIQQKITPVYTNLRVTYIQKSGVTFGSDIIEALASGTGPDAIILTNDMVARFANKIVPVPDTLFTLRQFNDSFVDNGSIFVNSKGILALPLWTDPLVMYWNKNIFASNNVARAPEYWDELLTLAPLLTKRDNSGNIQTSAVALGEFRNVTNAKDILATLVLQTGNPIIKSTANGQTAMLDGSNQTVPPIDTSLRFFTDFADPLKPIYSWNRSLADSKSAFLSENLAVYFGYASELTDIRMKNPNLNFDIAFLPQVRGNPYKLTFAKIGGIAVLKASQEQSQAFFVAELLSSADISGEMAKELALPSPRRDLLSRMQTDPLFQIFSQSALVGKSWFDPDAEQTNTILQSMVEDVLSGNKTIEDARNQAQAQFTALIEKIPSS